MSHLRPTQSVRITPGGSAIPGTRTTGASVDALEPEPWDQRVRNYAIAVGIDEEDLLEGFATRLDETVEALALEAELDIEVARTRVVGAIAGATGMVTDLVDVDLSDEVVAAALEEWEIDEPNAGDLAIARLHALHQRLSAGDQPEPDQVVGQVAYTLEVVPENAKEAVVWIAEGDSADDRRARAQAAQEVEAARAGDPRTTVAAAIDDALADGG